MPTVTSERVYISPIASFKTTGNNPQVLVIQFSSMQGVHCPGIINSADNLHYSSYEGLSKDLGRSILAVLTALKKSEV
jgi:hypothetical protein